MTAHDAGLDLETIIVERPRPGIVVATLNRPERLNAMTNTMFHELEQLALRLDQDDEVRVLIITGAGRAFCAGFDLAGYGDDERLAHQGTTRGLLTRQSEIATTIARLHGLKIPVIAAINGPCAGAGLSYAAACDIRIAAEGIVFSAAFLRAGFTACDLGSSWLLPRIVGTGRAHELMLTARRFDAEEALRIGLVTDVVPGDRLIATALSIADRIKQNPPLSTLMTKEGMWLAMETPSLAATIEFENRQQVLSAMTDDRDEAGLSFLEKRAPQYANR
jgi:enoyl-CoA hydratase/carnithine racemase